MPVETACVILESLGPRTDFAPLLPKTQKTQSPVERAEAQAPVEGGGERCGVKQAGLESAESRVESNVLLKEMFQNPRPRLA